MERGTGAADDLLDGWSMRAAATRPCNVRFAARAPAPERITGNTIASTPKNASQKWSWTKVASSSQKMRSPPAAEPVSLALRAAAVGAPRAETIDSGVPGVAGAELLVILLVSVGYGVLSDLSRTLVP